MNDTHGYLRWKNWETGNFGQFPAQLAEYYAVETGLRAGHRVLEIGFGNGPFLGWARSVGAEVVGVELSPALVSRARGLLGEDRAFESLNDPGLARFRGAFTHIVAFDVIEHIRQDDLAPFLAQARDLLAAEGRLLVRFPNGDSPFGRINQHADPTHVTTLGAEKLRYFARQAGLEVTALRAPRLARGRSPRPMLRRALLMAGRAAVERIFGYLYFGGRVIVLDPNYVAVMSRTTAD